jgi:hypothetical protein
MPFQQIIQTALIDWSRPLIDQIHLGLIDIDTRNLVPFFRKTGAGHDSHIARPDN